MCQEKENVFGRSDSIAMKDIFGEAMKLCIWRLDAGGGGGGGGFW